MGDPVEVTARPVAVAVAPVPLVAFEALRHPAVLSASSDVLAAVAHAIDCELPVALGLPPEAADELARVALGAVVQHLRQEAGATWWVAERTAALPGAGLVGPPAPPTGAALATSAG
ncbi:hypothetical protein [Quadrisphaera sp. INWT6]|uniref:hypothetical protein n=1 Tax=Quadrisphaera sp. INWT6 TaxID=2596917 RepID=UPI0018927E0A|nr:hypothetical protein [Quadrisphaera sp. INWT6]MBF5081185.1 hypothetical protein [Quadrisphaera sp. INWT6]